MEGNILSPPSFPLPVSGKGFMAHIFFIISNYCQLQGNFAVKYNIKPQKTPLNRH